MLLSQIVIQTYLMSFTWSLVFLWPPQKKKWRTAFSWSHEFSREHARDRIACRDVPLPRTILWLRLTSVRSSLTNQLLSSNLNITGVLDTKGKTRVCSFNLLVCIFLPVNGYSLFIAEHRFIDPSISPFFEWTIWLLLPWSFLLTLLSSAISCFLIFLADDGEFTCCTSKNNDKI